MSSNIHGLDNYSRNGQVGIQSSNNVSGKDDQLYVSSIYKIRTVTCFLLIINISVYLLQILAFYLYYAKRGDSWSCLIITFGAFQGGKVKNHYQYHRFITSDFLHNSIAHVGSNSLSLFFLGFQVENEIKNKLHYGLLYFVSGLTGDLLSLIHNQNNISLGASGCIIGLCGNFVIYFLLNYRNMSDRKKYTYGSMFLMLFINLFSGLSEGGENINMAAHMGGFLGGFAVSIILTYKKNYRLRFNNPSARKLYYMAVAFLISLPLIAIGVLILKKIPNITDHICKK
jgi:membrane associated rhomboid family serine protease